jgi:nitroimidazol reductase NimA-like FMN-containing flavoprotein (pyridoxamine 5'-phosphate oxidase superfamily)
MEEMDRAGCDEVLYREGAGMLALSEDDVPYVIPMSFGYDGTVCYIQITTSGRKNRVLTANARATLAIVSYDPESGRSESVLVEGTMEGAEGAAVEPGLEALANNAEFGTDLSVWGEPVQDVELALYRLVPTSISGRRFNPSDSQG